MNRDPPALADIWRSGPACGRGVQSLSAATLEELVLSKPYFDRQGLIVAHDDGRPVGFVHAGFCPNQEESALSSEEGVVCLLLVRPEYWQTEVPARLLARAEEYLRRRGVRTIHGAGSPTLSPFYLGLSGGSELRGVPDSALDLRGALVAAGYQKAGRYQVLQRDLADFRPAVSRQQLQVRRRSTVESPNEGTAWTWWEACALGCFEPLRFSVLPRAGGPAWASVLLWSMEQLSRSWGVRAAGLVHLRTDPSQRRQGVATCLVGEALARLKTDGFSLVEAQIPSTDTASARLFASLGFVETAVGTEYSKPT